MQPEKTVASWSHLGMLPEPALKWGTEPAAHSPASEFTWIRLTAEDLSPQKIYLGCQLSAFDERFPGWEAAGGQLSV